MTWKASGKPRSSKRKVSALPVRAMAAGRPHGPGATGAKRSRTGEEIKNGQRDQERAKHKNRSLYVSYFPGKNECVVTNVGGGGATTDGRG